MKARYAWALSNLGARHYEETHVASASWGFPKSRPQNCFSLEDGSFAAAIPDITNLRNRDDTTVSCHSVGGLIGLPTTLFVRILTMYSSYSLMFCTPFGIPDT